MRKKSNNPKIRVNPLKKYQSQEKLKINTSEQEIHLKNSNRLSLPHSSTMKRQTKKITKKKEDKQIPKVNLSVSECMSESDSSIDSINIVKQTNNVKEKVLSSLKVFKKVTTDFFIMNRTFEQEFISIEHEVNNIKYEVDSLFDESSRSRIELLMMKKKFLDSLDKQDCLSTKHSPVSNLSEGVDKQDYLYIKHSPVSNLSQRKNLIKIYDDPPEEILDSLKQEITELKIIIARNEEINKKTDAETNEIRCNAFKIQDSLENDGIQFDTEEKVPNCKICSVI